MHKFTEERFRQIKAQKAVPQDVLRKAYNTAKTLHVEDGPTAQPVIEPDGSMALKYLVEDGGLTVLLGVHEDPEEAAETDMIFAEGYDEVVFCGPLSDPDIVSQAREYLAKLGPDKNLIELDIDEMYPDWKDEV